MKLLNKLNNKIRKSVNAVGNKKNTLLVAGILSLAILGTPADTFANEQEDSTLETNMVVEDVIQQAPSTDVVEEEVKDENPSVDATEEDNDVIQQAPSTDSTEEDNSSVDTDEEVQENNPSNNNETVLVKELSLKMTKSEWNDYVAKMGWDNTKIVDSQGNIMIFEAFKCGTKVANVYLEIVEEEVPEVETPELPVEPPVADGTDNDDMVVEPEEEVEEPSLPAEPPVEDGTDNDNMVVEPEEEVKEPSLPAEPPVEDGTDNDDMVVEPEEVIEEPSLPAETLKPVIKPSEPVVEQEVHVTEPEVYVVEKTEQPKKSNPIKEKQAVRTVQRKVVDKKPSKSDSFKENPFINPQTGDNEVFVNIVVMIIVSVLLVVANKNNSVFFKYLKKERE